MNHPAEMSFSTSPQHLATGRQKHWPSPCPLSQHDVVQERGATRLREQETTCVQAIKPDD